MSDKSELSVKEPEILKKAEYEMGLQFIERGLWRTRNLAKALSVDEDTISAWKKTKRYQDAYSGAVMKFISRRKDVEVILSELDVETPQEPSLTQINNYMNLTDEQLDTIIRSKAGKAGVITATTGEGEAESGEPA